MWAQLLGYSMIGIGVGVYFLKIANSHNRNIRNGEIQGRRIK